MKKLLTSLTLCVLSIAGAHAATTATGPNSFNVNINLTPKCEVNVVTGSALTLNYTSFQTGPAQDSFDFTVKCTTSLGYGLGFDTASQLDSTTGLTYNLSFVSFGGAATKTGTGTGASVTHTVYGQIDSGASGTACNTSGICSNSASPAAEKVRTVIVTY